MGIGIGGVSDFNSINCPKMVKSNENQKSENVTAGSDVSNSQISAEKKIKQADEFLAQHDKLYAQQQATVMETITDGMAVAQEIARRMSSGAKVSQSDENNLMQYDMQMYMAAKNAQMMAERKKDMSNESLIDQFVERHANDRKDWTSELDQRIQSINQDQTTVAEKMVVTKSSVADSVEVADADISQSVGNIDISV
ncbi:MAG: hypothetical protein K2K56_08765 [Lachnospiraceae bacterium]|nr:hypothetical protein [Lachnospiraceae bacterium]